MCGKPANGIVTWGSRNLLGRVFVVHLFLFFFLSTYAASVYVEFLEKLNSGAPEEPPPPAPGTEELEVVVDGKHNTRNAVSQMHPGSFLTGRRFSISELPHSYVL